MSKKFKKQGKKKGTSKREIQDLIFSVFSANPSKTFNYKQIAAKIDASDFGSKQIIMQLLAAMTAQERLIEESTGKYKLKPQAGYVTGIVDLTSKGYGFIVSEEMDEHVFVSQTNLKHALNGDKVKVFLYARKKTFHPEGEVVEILERSKTTFVGTVEMSHNFAFLIVNSRKMPYDIFLPVEGLNGAKHNDKALVRITDWPKKAKSPFGEVIEVLGKAGSHQAEMHAILAEFDLPLKFSEEVIAEAEKIKANIPQTEEMRRRDFRGVPTFTIDPHDAKDFDDALSVAYLNNGNIEVGVHIADVTYYFDEGSMLDNEALERATSVYLVDRVVPMLPEHLSNYLCSLRPNEDKLCFSAVFELDENANIINEWFGRTIINSQKRFTYEEAQELLENKAGEWSEEMILLDTLAKKLRVDRFSKGSIAFDREEVKFNLDDQGHPIGVYFKQPKDSNKLIEEFMLLANKRVALFIGKSDKKKRTFVYRIHDEPNPEKLKTFSYFIRRFGYRINLKTKAQTNASLNALLEDVKEKKEKNLIETLAVRTMAKAAYSTINIGHFGLGFSHYSHFTSPIRRYPDMMVHRLLQAYLNGESSKDQKKYEQMCVHSSEMEKRAEEAERASIKYKQVEFMQDKIGEEFSGIISGVAEWGFYVEIDENKVEGLVPMRDMNDDVYIFDEENYCIYGKHHGRKYQLGDEVKIVIVKASLAKKQLTFRLLDEV
ncbi:MAG: ribonuclease R [Bacteroidales bacterium]|nr:ribonuclease R [Bacteroidales bacterium]